jgi:hypothetical protein
VLLLINGFTLMATDADVSLHPPELTSRLYQVVALNDEGA